jgi:predicted transcriptional regulator
MDYKNYIQQTLANAQPKSKNEFVDLSSFTKELNINSMDKKILLSAIAEGRIKTKEDIREGLKILNQIKINR